MSDEQLEIALRSGLRCLPCANNGGYSDAHITQLIAFVKLLTKWNRVYNLTAVRDPAQMVTRHLLDSLSVQPYVQGVSVIDVGAGAGLPGIPLAIVMPGTQFVLLDSNNKKTRFMQQAKTELALNNVKVICSRVENYLHKIDAYNQNVKFDTVISRAFSSLHTMLSLSGHLCATNGRMLAMKGVYPRKELVDIPKPFEIKAVHELQVPGLEEERYLIEMACRQISLQTAK